MHSLCIIHAFRLHIRLREIKILRACPHVRLQFVVPRIFSQACAKISKGWKKKIPSSRKEIRTSPKYRAGKRNRACWQTKHLPPKKVTSQRCPFLSPLTVRPDGLFHCCFCRPQAPSLRLIQLSLSGRWSYPFTRLYSFCQNQAWHATQ